jgi:orotidine-5'-phosphate decarboxylase
MDPARKACSPEMPILVRGMGALALEHRRGRAKRRGAGAARPQEGMGGMAVRLPRATEGS